MGENRDSIRDTESDNLSSVPNAAMLSLFPDSVTSLLSPSCMSLKTSGDPSIQLFEPATFSICTHVLSSTEGDANSPLGSVNSMAYFSSVPVGRERECVQTVAVRLTGGGFDFPGTLKFTLALQNTGFIVACTIHLYKTCDAINCKGLACSKMDIKSKWNPFPELHTTTCLLVMLN